MITVEDVYKIRDQQDVDLSDLSKYLKDIISNIEDELTSKLHVNYNKHFSQHSNGRTNNWRFRKNHNFMDKYSSQDKVLMNINCEINKITETNYKVIAEKVEQIIKEHSSLEDDNDNNKIHVESYLDYIIKTVFTKSIEQPEFGKYNMDFLKALGYHKSDFFANYVSNFSTLFSVKDYENTEQMLLDIIRKDLKLSRNTGELFGRLYIDGGIQTSTVLNNMKSMVANMVNLLDWLPLNDLAFGLRLNLIVGFTSTTLIKISENCTLDEVRHIETILTGLTTHINIPVRSKFAIQDVLDLIPTLLLNQNKNKNKKFDIRNSTKWSSQQKHSSKSRADKVVNKDKAVDNDKVVDNDSDDGWERVERKKIDKRRAKNKK